MAKLNKLNDCTSVEISYYSTIITYCVKGIVLCAEKAKFLPYVADSLVGDI